MLDELRKKNDIQSFFKTIIFKDVKNLEFNYSSYNLNFNISRLTDDYQRQSLKDSNKKKRQNRDVYLKYSEHENSDSISLEEGCSQRNKKKMQQEQENFNKKYSPILNKEELQKIIEKNKNNKNMYDYCYININDCSLDKDIFSNQKLMDNLSKCQEPAHLFA